jgi:Mn-dependent DtxR family transcriptional regulator
MTLGLGLLATLGSDSPLWAASGYMLVLGLGLGMVMQVLVLAVQNAVDYSELGVATSGTTLFRSTGGSVGVSLFGAIFAANLASGLAGRLPMGTTLPNMSEPSAIQALPADLRGIYLDAFTMALHPVFVLAALLAAFSFVLTWFLKEEPLRGPARAETIGESFATPHDATSLEELEFILTQLEQRESRWVLIQRMAQRLTVPLEPDEIWLLVQLCREGSTPLTAELCYRLSVPHTRVDDIAARMAAKELVTRMPDGSLIATNAGRQEFESMLASYRSRLAQFLDRWSPEDHAEVRTMLTAHARALVQDIPAAPDRTVT